MRAATASSGCAASSSTCPALAARAGCDVVHSLASTAPLRGPLRARHDDPRPELQARPGHALRPARARHGRARPGRGAPLAPRHRRRRARRATTSSSTCAHRPGQGRRRAAGGRAARRPRPTPGGGAARASSGWATGRRAAQRQRQAPAQEPRRGCSTRSPASRPSARPVLVVPGYPTPHEAELRARAAALGVDGRRRAGRPGCPARTSRASTRSPTCVVFPSLLRGLRPAGARGDGARRAGRLLGPLVAARGRGRRGAALRPRGRRRDPARRSSGCCADGAAARATWRAAGASRRPRVHAGSGRPS